MEKIGKVVYYNTILGIDPGQKGGCALIRDSELIELHPFTRDRFENVVLLKNILDKDYSNLHVIVEEGHAFKGQGVNSVFSFGFFHGMIYGVFCGKAPVVYVRPREWQKFHGLNKKRTTKDRNVWRRERKKMSVQKAKELYPGWASKIKNHDGMAEAILIARYGMALLKP